MVAPLLLAAPALAEAAKSKSAAITNDIAVIRGTTRARGKGRAKRPGVDYEIHVNPVSIGVGAGVLAVGALAAGVGAYALGLGVNRSEGRDLDRRAINHFELVDGRWEYRKTVIYSARGRSLRTTNVQVVPNVPRSVLTDVEMLDQYVVTYSRISNQVDGEKRKEIVTQRLHSAKGGNWQIYDRPRNSFIKVF